MKVSIVEEQSAPLEVVIKCERTDDTVRRLKTHIESFGSSRIHARREDRTVLVNACDVLYFESVLIWAGVICISVSGLPVMTKNILTFFAATPLMPLAYLMSKPLGITFSDKADPLSSLGILFSAGQMLYILIAMWVCSAVPEKMLMVYAMIYGAHLLPFGWLYRSKTYYVMSVTDTLAVLVIGCTSGRTAVAVFMLISQIGMCVMLGSENRKR